MENVSNLNQKVLSVVALELSRLLNETIEPEKIRVSALIRNDYYIGRKFILDGIMAIWYADHAVVEFFDRKTGVCIESLNLQPATLQSVA